MNSKVMRHNLITLLSGISLMIGMCISPSKVVQPVSAHRIASYDISQWQGKLNHHQIKHLRHEVHFMILRGEYGSAYKDKQFSHTAHLLNHYHIPYGAYDYSIYRNPSQAKDEADMLYNRAPYANFYINDAEENNAGHNFNKSTRAWSHEIHKLSNKPTVLYSDLAFMNSHVTKHTRHTYNANWIASYNKTQPRTNYHYALWQYSDTHKSKALNRDVDADTIPHDSNKTMSFWTGRIHNNNKTIIHKVPQIKNRSIITIPVQYHSVK